MSDLCATGNWDRHVESKGISLPQISYTFGLNPLFLKRKQLKSFYSEKSRLLSKRVSSSAGISKGHVQRVFSYYVRYTQIDTRSDVPLRFL